MAKTVEQAKFRKLRSVTLPLLKIEKNTERFFYLHGPMYLGEKVDPKKDPATLVHAVDLETGEEGLVICPAVMQSELRRHYGAAGYVGKSFGVAMTRVPEKKYNLVTLSEVATPDEFTLPTTPAQAGAAGAVEASIKAGRRPGDEDEDGVFQRDDSPTPAAPQHQHDTTQSEPAKHRARGK